MNRILILSLYLTVLTALASDRAKPNIYAFIYAVERTISVQRLSRRLPSSAMRDFQRALTAMRKDDIRGYETYLAKAVEAAPLFTEALNNLGAYYLREGELERAEIFLNRAAASDGACAAVASNLAILEVLRNEPAKAELHARRAVKIDPAFVEARYLLGAILLKRGSSTEEAAGLLRSVADTYPAAHMRAAVALSRLGRMHDAGAEVRAYLRTGDAEFVQLAKSWLAEMNPKLSGSGAK